MGSTNNSSSEDQLNQILADYLQAAESGEPPDEEKLLEQYPEFADQLREFFGDKRKIDKIAKPEADEATSPVQPVDTASENWWKQFRRLQSKTPNSHTIGEPLSIPSRRHLSRD